jgi:hypothetical protein
VDAVSQGFGRTDPNAKATKDGTGVLTGGNVGPLTYAEQSKSWGKAPRAPKRDTLQIRATNLALIVVNPARARLDCHAKLDVTTDGPLAVKLAGCRHRAYHFG